MSVFQKRSERQGYWVVPWDSSKRSAIHSVPVRKTRTGGSRCPGPLQRVNNAVWFDGVVCARNALDVAVFRS